MIADAAGYDVIVLNTDGSAERERRFLDWACAEQSTASSACSSRSGRPISHRSCGQAWGRAHRGLGEARRRPDDRQPLRRQCRHRRRKSEFWRKSWVNNISSFSKNFPSAFRISQDRGSGMIACGTSDWTDYRVSSEVTAHLGSSAGLVARVQGLRRHYALQLEAGDKARRVLPSWLVSHSIRPSRDSAPAPPGRRWATTPYLASLEPILEGMRKAGVPEQWWPPVDSPLSSTPAVRFA
jgi:hypothetical protein